MTPSQQAKAAGMKKIEGFAYFVKKYLTPYARWPTINS